MVFVHWHDANRRPNHCPDLEDTLKKMQGNFLPCTQGGATSLMLVELLHLEVNFCHQGFPVEGCLPRGPGLWPRGSRNQKGLQESDYHDPQAASPGTSGLELVAQATSQEAFFYLLKLRLRQKQKVRNCSERGLQGSAKVSPTFIGLFGRLISSHIMRTTLCGGRMSFAR